MEDSSFSKWSSRLSAARTLVSNVDNNFGHGERCFITVELSLVTSGNLEDQIWDNGNDCPDRG
eukprot:1721471-Pyramimonas_sp.AAC.1